MMPVDPFVSQLAESGMPAGDTIEDFLPPEAMPKRRPRISKGTHSPEEVDEVSGGRGLTRPGKVADPRKLRPDGEGRGGRHGTGFNARHRRTDRFVAVKLLPSVIFRREIGPNVGPYWQLLRTVWDAIQKSNLPIATGLESGSLKTSFFRTSRRSFSGSKRGTRDVQPHQNTKSRQYPDGQDFPPSAGADCLWNRPRAGEVCPVPEGREQDPAQPDQGRSSHEA